MNATQSPGRHRQSLKRCHGNKAAAVALLAASTLLVGGAAQAATGPGVVRWVSRPVTAAPTPTVFCQYEVVGHYVNVGLPAGQVGHGERVVVHVGLSQRVWWMPASGVSTFYFPSTLPVLSQVTASWDGHECGPA